MPKPSLPDSLLLAAAVEGLELQRNQLDEQIMLVKAMLGRGRPGRIAQSGGSAPRKRQRRQLSAAARARISAAQKKRWAKYHKSKGS
jgi:hypothetical protein